MRENHRMDLSLRWLLWLCVVAMGIGALGLLAVAYVTRPHRGVKWWLGALGSGALGLAMVAGGAGTYWAWFPIHALVAIWPTMALIGTRQFHARLPLWGMRGTDFGVLWSCLAALALAEIWIPAGYLREVCAVLVSLTLHLYPAVVLLACPQDEDQQVLRGLGLIALICALAPQAMWLAGLSVSAIWHASAAAMVPGVLMTCALGLVLLARRHALHWEARSAQPMAAYGHGSHRQGRVDAFHEWIRHALGANGSGCSVVVLIGARDRHPPAPKSQAEREAAAARLSHCSRDVIRTADLTAQPEPGTVALLLKNTSRDEAVAVVQRLASRWSLLADPKSWPGNSLVFGITEAFAKEDSNDVWHRVSSALVEARRPGRAQVVSAVAERGVLSFRRLVLRESRR